MTTDRAVRLSGELREAIVDAIYQGRIRSCRETVENWGPPEDEAETHSLLLRILRGESEKFVADAEPTIAAALASRERAAAEAHDHDTCGECAHQRTQARIEAVNEERAEVLARHRERPYE